MTSTKAAAITRDMNDLWMQSHHVRAVGTLIVDAAWTLGCLEQLGRAVTVTIRPSAGAKARTFVVTS